MSDNNNDSICLTVAQLSIALANCDPDKKVQFFNKDGEEIKIVFVEKSLWRSIVYLRSETPVVNEGCTSTIETSEEIPYLGEFIRWEDEAQE